MGWGGLQGSSAPAAASSRSLPDGVSPLQAGRLRPAAQGDTRGTPTPLRAATTMTSRALPTEPARPPQRGMAGGTWHCGQPRIRHPAADISSGLLQPFPPCHWSRWHSGDIQRRQAVPGCVMQLKAFLSRTPCPLATGVAGHQPCSEARSPNAPKGSQLPTGWQGISDPKTSLPAVPCQAGHSHCEQHRLHQPRVLAVWWCWGGPGPLSPQPGADSKLGSGT